MSIAQNELLEEKRRAEAALAYRLEFEQLVTRLSSRFIYSSAPELDDAITWALEELGKFTGVDRCVVFQILDDPALVHFTHEWCTEAVQESRYRFAVVSMEIFPWALEMYRKFQLVYVSDVDQLPPEAQSEKEMWQSTNVKSVLAVPLVIGKELIGVIALTTECDKKVWAEEDTRLLETLAQMIANAIQRQRSEAALNQLEAQFRTLANELPAAIAIMQDDRFVYINKAAERMSGYSRDDVSSLDIDRFLHPEERQKLLGILESIGDSQLSTGTEIRFVNKDGEDRWVELQARRVQFEGTDSILVAGIDTTDRHDAEQAVRRSEELLRLVVQNMPVMMAAFDEHGTLLVWNREAERVTGYPPSEFVGNPCAMEMLYPDPAYRAQIVRKWNDRSTEYRDWEWQMTCRDGSSRTVSWFNISAQFPIPGWASWGIGVDVTDRRRLERQLLEVSAREQRRIGQDLHDGLGQHLTGIGFKSQVLSQDLAAKGLPDAGAASAIVAMVSDAINQTRSLARGLYPVHLESDGLMTSLQELAGSTQSVYGILCRFVCEEPVLIYDNTVAVHLYRIAQEAVNNALRHGKPKSVEIALRSEDECVSLCVLDDGVGIGKLANGQQGLGLSIMQYRARMIGGSLDVQAGERGGTEVICSWTMRDTAVTE